MTIRPRCGSNGALYATDVPQEATTENSAKGMRGGGRWRIDHARIGGVTGRLGLLARHLVPHGRSQRGRIARESQRVPAVRIGRTSARMREPYEWMRRIVWSKSNTYNSGAQAAFKSTPSDVALLEASAGPPREKSWPHDDMSSVGKSELHDLDAFNTTCPSSSSLAKRLPRASEHGGGEAGSTMVRSVRRRSGPRGVTLITACTRSLRALEGLSAQRVREQFDVGPSAHWEPLWRCDTVDEPSGISGLATPGCGRRQPGVGGRAPLRWHVKRRGFWSCFWRLCRRAGDFQATG